MLKDSLWNNQIKVMWQKSNQRNAGLEEVWVPENKNFIYRDGVWLNMPIIPTLVSLRQPGL
jgi:hypothetical protein